MEKQINKHTNISRRKSYPTSRLPFAWVIIVFISRVLSEKAKRIKIESVNKVDSREMKGVDSDKLRLRRAGIYTALLQSVICDSNLFDSPRGYYYQSYSLPCTAP